MPTTISFDIDDDAMIVLKNDLVDVQTWVEQAVLGKINNCKKRMITEWIPKIHADPSITSVPANEVDLVRFIKTLPDYKDRAEREAVVEQEKPE